MLRFTYFVSNLLRKIKCYDVFWKHGEKIMFSFKILILNTLQNLRLRGVYLELRV